MSVLVCVFKEKGERERGEMKGERRILSDFVRGIWRERLLKGPSRGDKSEGEIGSRRKSQ